MTEEDRSALVKGSADRSAIITGDHNTATITITNYYYHENTTVVPIDRATEDENLKCPYRGLFHFGPDDAEFFFGHQFFVEELFTATQTRNFIPVLGASGSGKSSVVLAGLVPKLQKEGYWKFTHFRPGANPFHALAESLVPLYEPSKNATEQMLQARQLAKYFADGLVPLQDVLSQIERNYHNHRVLLIADQFEELYTLCTDQKIRNSFLDTLLASFEFSPSGIQSKRVLVTTMRADFLGNALSYPKFGDVLQNADVKIRSMNRSELRQVIEMPALKLAVTFQDGLVERILDDIENEPGNLPLLEFALTQLWKLRKGKQLNHTAYEEIGEVKGALARHADDNYGKLSATEKEQVRRIFIQLVRPGEGTEDTRRLATKAELGDKNWELVKKLADNRLIVTSQNAANQETAEVVHEALIRNWGEFRQWINADRSFRAWQERLRVSMYQWEQTQRDKGGLLRGVALADAQEKLQGRHKELSSKEQEFIQASAELRDYEKKREKRRRQLTISGLVGGLVVALSLAGLAVAGWRSAQINQMNAFAQSSNGFLNLDEPKAVASSVKAGVQMQRGFWVDADTRTQVELALLNTVHNVAAPNTLGGHANTVYGASFSFDGKMLASASADKTVKLWNTSTGKEIKTLTGHTGTVFSVSFSPDGKILASSSDDKTVKLWDISTGKEIKTLIGHTNAVHSVSFNHDGKILATASRDNTVKLWDISTGKEIKTLIGHTNAVYGISFSSNGKMLASAGLAENTAKLWDTSTGKDIRTLVGHKKDVWGASFSPDGKILATASGDQTVKLWDTSTGKEIKTLSGHVNEVYGVSFSPDGKILATASADKTVKLWDTSTGKEIKTLSGHVNEVYGVSFSRDGKVLASSSADKTVKLWNTSTRKEIRTLAGHTKSVHDISFSPDGKILATASTDKTVKLWDTSTRKEIETLTGHREAVNGVSFSRDGKMLATASSDKTVKLWDTSTHKETKTLTGHTNYVYGVSFSPDSKMLASNSADGTVKLWNTSTGEEIKTLNGYKNKIFGISFSPDGQKLAAASRDQTVKLWDINTGELFKTLKGHTNCVYGVSFSPDGKILASAGRDNMVKLWNTSTGKEIRTLTGHKNAVYGVSFSPNGRILASASVDYTVKLWDTSSGKEIQTLTGHTNAVRDVKFSPNGIQLATASLDNTVKLWRLDFDYLLKEGCDFMQAYYKINPPDNESEKHICDSVDSGK